MKRRHSKQKKVPSPYLYRRRQISILKVEPTKLAKKNWKKKQYRKSKKKNKIKQHEKLRESK